jgi:uncharacterized protein YqgC (DUF456 family)
MCGSVAPVTLTEVAVGIVILIGLAGIIVPVLPGSILVLGAIVAWALEVGGTTAWLVVAVATTFLAVGTIVKYLIPGKQMKAAGVPNSTLWIGALFAIVGFFVIPVVGMLVGFVVGVYVAERQRVGADDAWPSTKSALKAVGVSILIELAAALLATGTWIVGIVIT